MIDLPKTLIIFGIIMTLIGVFISFGSSIPFLGKLPGDIYIKRENVTIYFPLTTSILISIVLSFIWRLMGK